MAFSTDFPKLVHLSLEDNGLNSVPDVSRIADTLAGLTLMNNRITSLQNMYNMRFPKLLFLGLNKNRIIAVSVKKLEMPQLKELLLHDNLIKVIEPMDGKFVSSNVPCSQLYVTLHDNPWHCDVSLAWLKDFKLSNNTLYTGPICRVVIIAFTSMTCSTPLQLQGKPVWEAGTLWRHQMEAFSALLVLCAGNSPVTGEFPSQRPVTRSFDIFFDLRLSKPLSKQSRRRRFATPYRSLWRHCNDGTVLILWMIMMENEVRFPSEI